MNYIDHDFWIYPFLGSLLNTKNDCTLLHSHEDVYTHTNTHTYAHTNTSPHDIFSKEILALMLGQMKNKPSLVLVLYVELCS